MSSSVFFVLGMSLCCLCSVLTLPLSLYRILLMSLPWHFFRKRLLVGLWRVWKHATFDPNQVRCLSLEISLPPVLHMTKCLSFRGSEKTWGCLSFTFHFFLAKVIILNFILIVFVLERGFLRKPCDTHVS